MNRINKCAVWFYMYSKRLLHKFSFVILLCLIPVVVFLANSAMSEDSSVLRIALYSEDDSQITDDIISALAKKDSIIQYKICSSRNDALRMVETSKADAAWILMDDFENRIAGYMSDKKSEPFIEVIQRSDTVSLQLSREVLFGAVFEDFSYAMYRNFIYTNITTRDDIPESEIIRYYSNTRENDNVVEVQRLDSDAPVAKNTNYLTTPLRGLLSLLIMLCTMAAAMYFLKDQQEGKYDWMQPQRRMIPAFASCLSAALFSAVAVFAALAFSGIFTNFVSEFISMLLFVISATGFCLLLCVLFRSPGKLGATIPGIIIIMLALSPIFFNMKVLRPVRLMLPTYYYLNGVYNPAYYMYTLVYSVSIYFAAIILNPILNRSGKRKLLI